MNNFVPLRIISCYSFLQSGLTMEKIQRSVIKNDYFGLGLCDRNIMFGVPSFVKASEAINKPYIIGVEVSVEDDTLCLYALNEEGYHHLMEISTAINRGDFSFEFLKERTSGLLAIIETYSGKFKLLFESDDESFSKYLFDYSLLFKDHFYLGLEVIQKEDVSYANKIRRFANEHGYDCVAFPHVLYEKKDDAIALKIAEAILKRETLEIEELQGQQYFMPYEYYQKLYRQVEIDNTRKILESASFNFHQKRGELLRYPVDNSPKALTDACFLRLEALGLKDNETYVNRLNYELDTIISLGYADYFLIVQDYVGFAKKNGILVGSGRGSAAGSLVSYLLDITQIDPIKYDLQFERFLNPYRQSMPDIDVDFMDIRRNDVVQYIRDRFGNEKVATIVTFTTIQAKQALRDIGRVYNIKPFYIDRLSKLMPPNTSFKQAYKQIPDFKQEVDRDSYLLKIVRLASKIEGLIRQSSLHAAGIVLNNSPLENALPIITDLSDHYITQYEDDYLEEQGFLKMDVLSIRNLTVISRCVDLINAHYQDAHLDKQNLPFDDPKVYELIASGQTAGLFQINTSSMKKAIKTLKPNCFNDVVAIIALNRPGPRKFIATYAKRKEGKETIAYDDPSLEPILKETYGVIVYQEQVNKIATAFAGFSAGEADLFRSAISKKKIEKMLAGEKSFIEGAIKLGHDEKIVKKIYSTIKDFADYAFNKAHSVTYSIIACQMAYLKAYYPLEFYAASLEIGSADSEDGESDTKLNQFINEMKKRNFVVLLPNINISTTEFLATEQGLMFPLNKIKGINETLANNIVEERKNGEFKDFFDFVARMYRYKIEDKQIMALIDGGSFDSFSLCRASFRASIKSAIQYATLLNKEDGQLNIGISDYLKPYLIEDKDDPLENLEKEYEALGIMISDSPLRYKADVLHSKNVISIVDAKENESARIGGMIRSVRKQETKKKKETMAIVRIVDESDEIELTIFPSLYKEVSAILKKNTLVIAEVKAQMKDEFVNYICDSLTPLEDE